MVLKVKHNGDNVKKKEVQTFSPDHEFWWRIGQTNRSVYAAASTVELYS